ncbi:MAG: macrolide ABC transporter ATP-binding protein [Candidatus Lloydbacteria bacterium RIFCSPHIGHO2_01_FULL_49_22]|uniref:Macrolide ABC transporter ATP-binding protein n=1 Tax=Candidatus Lloydbacteria bacterium RIFCSPHIGHO2_01_FULL_49_22 TaxID=1798658 RepID=A0A1G2CW29_9BACT|nr:MAG: macrolide ABC transporter ATP-binding protein [Candidatus Lloydbacteria bacterium RIFCSPHIGHO2_01_FULL_49_22]OGZ09143.1 MAG: macrolide ABC transporter ATP-binding protein [Candidatus Lloydbacteria bacterium RIFCSPHIGHO2_02_FULL_50_18]
MALIETKGIEKVFGGETPTVALRNINFIVDRGEFVSIVGPSGSGKSTLLQILGLLDSPTAGSYFLDGKDTSTLSDEELAKLRNRTLGFVFQSFNLLARTSVLENVKLPLAYSNFPSRSWDKMAMAQIEAVGLLKRVYHEPSQLSGGERQRVAIARALVTNPEIIFADEPTGNLDSASGKVVMDTLTRLHHEGKTVILITHDRNVARRAHRAVLCRDGAIVWEGDVNDIPEIS